MIDERLPHVDLASWTAEEIAGRPSEWTPKGRIRNITSAANINPLDGFIRVSGTTTATLETAVSADGRVHYIKNIGSGVVTIACTGAQTIDGSATLSLPLQYDAVFVRSNGTGWEVFGGSGSPVGGGGSGSVDPCWARVAADGTVLASRRVDSVSRVAEGIYDVTLDFTAPTVGGEIELAAVATPSSTAGNGGAGVTIYKEYSGHDAAVSDTNADSGHMMYIASTNEIWVTGDGTDIVYVHDLANFTGTVDTITQPVGSYIRSGGGQQACLNKDKDYVWISGDSGGGGSPIRAIDVATRTVTSFGTTTDSTILGADSTYILQREGSVVKRYTHNIGAGTLSSSSTIFTDANSIRRGAWDDANRLWFTNSSGIVQFYMTTPSYVQHTFPPSYSTVVSDPIYDSSRRCIYIVLSTGAVSALWRYTGWTDNVAYSGAWTRLFDFTATTSGLGLWHDTDTDVLYVTDNASTAGSCFVYRYFMGSGGLKIDAVSCKDTSTPDNPQIDYTVGDAPACFYLGEYGYILANKTAGSHYLVRIAYSGDEIDFGGGASLVSSVLLAHTNIVDADTVRVELFRQMSPILRSDGEFSVSIESGA